MDWPHLMVFLLVYPIALRQAKNVYNFGLSECNRIKDDSAGKEQCHFFLSFGFCSYTVFRIELEF